MCFFPTIYTFSAFFEAFEDLKGELVVVVHLRHTSWEIVGIFIARQTRLLVTGNARPAILTQMRR